jgi:hypothetical protein
MQVNECTETTRGRGSGHSAQWGSASSEGASGLGWVWSRHVVCQGCVQGSHPALCCGRPII